jgi:hypothetical protein
VHSDTLPRGRGAAGAGAAAGAARSKSAVRSLSTGVGVTTRCRPCELLLPYFFAVASSGLEFRRLTTLVNAVPRGEVMTEAKDSDEAHGAGMSREAMVEEAKDSGGAPLGDNMDVRTRFRLRRKCTGERMVMKKAGHAGSATNEPQKGVSGVESSADPACLRLPVKSV